MRSIHRFSVYFLVALFPLIAFAADGPRQHGMTIEWQAAIADSVLSVQHPNGEVFTETFRAGRAPAMRMNKLEDGLYSYELRTESADVQTGTFQILNGAVVAGDLPENAVARVRPPAQPSTNTFFADDVSAAGGVCAGADCTNAESYGFTTIKLKENNLRIRFEDTSTTAGFASTDWQLSANDTASGGANKFFVEDITAVTTPFVIEGATPNNTLYVDSNGRIGIKTSTPGRDLTIANTVSPIIRMEQSLSPFQAWDIVANNNNFYVRDVNHEVNPFIIEPSAPTNSLVVDTTGNIGLGTAAPAFQIHHSSGARLDAGVWIDASSRGVKQDITDLDRETAYDALRSLQPVTFAYKAKPSDGHVGFIAEDVPDLVATPDRKGIAPMDVVAVLTKVVQEQQAEIAEMRARLESLEKK